MKIATNRFVCIGFSKDAVNVLKSLQTLGHWIVDHCSLDRQAIFYRGGKTCRPTLVNTDRTARHGHGNAVPQLPVSLLGLEIGNSECI